MTTKFMDRIAEVLSDEMQEPEQWIYLSFADEKFNGAVIIRAHGITDAVMKCHLAGINPGGQVMGVFIPEEHLPPESYRNRLLTREEITEFWPDAKTIREHEAGQGQLGKL